MAKFLDESGLSILWELVRNADVKIVTGEYAGAGAAQSITFPFPPKFILIRSKGNSIKYAIYIDTAGNFTMDANISNVSIDTLTATKSADGCTITIEHDDTWYSSLSYSQHEYVYFGIG